MKKQNKVILKKQVISKRNNKMDPNNNKNIPANPIIKKRGKKIHDDGFEHRTSKETSV
jgi:hypothetical protein